jgi:hypothetical protein
MSRQSLGIVSVQRALLDSALGVAEAARQIGAELDSDRAREMYWCTLCSQVITKRTANRHRQRHSLKVHTQMQSSPDALGELRRTLNEKYGVCPAV